MSIDPPLDVQKALAKQASEATVLEREVRALQKRVQPLDQGLILLRERLRKVYINILLLDIRYASEKDHDVEGALWMRVYHKPMDLTKSYLSKFKAEQAVSRPVEYRKAMTAFSKFLAEATAQYRFLIEQIIKHYNVVELDHVVRHFQPEFNFIETDGQPANDGLTAIVSRIIHSIMIRLGDLARYKELYAAEKSNRKNWGPALGYYHSARQLLPESGAPMNQLAVIAMYSEDHLSTLYHFLRAALAVEHFPTARDNFELGLKKIQRKLMNPDHNDVTVDFVVIVARSYNGGLVAATELSQFLERLSEEIAQRHISSEQLFQLCTIVVALSFLSAKAPHSLARSESAKIIGDLSSRLNAMLLDSMSHELSKISGVKSDMLSMISPVMRRILPSMRLQSCWFQHNMSNFRPNWTKFLSVMTQCGKVFPRASLPRLKSYLAEDEDLVGFVPIQGKLTSIVLNSKKDCSIPPLQEALLRIDILLTDAALIAEQITHALDTKKSDEHDIKIGRERSDQNSDHDMPTILGDMVDALVGVNDSDEEQLLFKGRSHRKQARTET